MSRQLTFIAILILSNNAMAQDAMRSFFGGVMYKSTGWGLAYQNRLDNPNKLGRQIEAEFASYHHPQETKSFNTEVNNPSPYVFGKLNKAAILKLNCTFSKRISTFSDAQRVGIDLTAGAGFTLGFLKPVYLNIIYPDALGFETLVAEKFDPNKHTDKTRIAGYTDNRVGWSELTYKPGLNVSAGLGFNWGYFTNFPKRLETGFYLEYFNKGLPVMAFVKNKTLQQGLYVRLLFGKRVDKN